MKKPGMDLISDAFSDSPARSTEWYGSVDELLAAMHCMAPVESCDNPLLRNVGFRTPDGVDHVVSLTDLRGAKSLMWATLEGRRTIAPMIGCPSRPTDADLDVHRETCKRCSSLM